MQMPGMWALVMESRDGNVEQRAERGDHHQQTDQRVRLAIAERLLPVDGEVVQSEAPDCHLAEPCGTEQRQEPDDHRQSERDGRE